MKLLAENRYGHGAIPVHPIRRFFKRHKRGIAKAVQPFDWSKGYDSTTLIPAVAIKDQGQSDSCGGQASSYLIEVLEKLSKNDEGEISAKSIYAPIAYPGGGTTIGAIETQLNASGSNLEALVPSYEGGEAPTEAFMADKSFLTTQIIEDAMTRAGYKSISISIDMDSIASAIQIYGAVMWEIEGQNNGTWLSRNPKPPVDDEDLWAHYMCQCGAGAPQGVQEIKSFQSWGTDTGENGYQYFNQDYIDSGYILDVIAFYKPAPVSAPIPVMKIPWWSWIFKLFDFVPA